MSPAVPEQPSVVTSIPGPKSQQLHARRTAAVADGVSSAFGLYIDRAHGGIVVDVDDNAFIDLTSGVGVTTIGHTDPAVTAAAAEQAGKLTHTLFSIAPYEPYVRVAELLAEHTPGDHAKKSVIVSTGAEAVENAVKVARRYTKRPGVAVLDHAFHGRTNLTMTMTFKSMPYSSGFGPFTSDVYRAPDSYPFRDGLDGPAAATRTIEHLERSAGAENLACLVVEPIQGEGGFIVPAPGYLTALQEWCTASGIVFVADEIQSGMARTGRWYASEHENLVPDLVTTAKGIAAGFPLACVTGRAEIMDAAHPGGLGGTFAGNPISCAAAIAVFERIESEGMLQRATDIGDLMLTALRDMQSRVPSIADVRGRGAMLAIELVDPATGAPDSARVAQAIQFAAQRGVLLLAAGTDGNVLRFLPNLATSDDLLRQALGVLEEGLTG